MSKPFERMRQLVNDNLVMGLRFQMNRELNKLESEIEQELNSRAERVGWLADELYRYKLQCERYEVKIAELTRKMEILKAYGVEIVDTVAGGYEVYNEKIREVSELQAQVDELEELAVDLYADLMEYGCTPNAHRADYRPRFEALGVEVSEYETELPDWLGSESDD